MYAAGQPEASKGKVMGLAIGASTTAVLLHTFSRRGGILVNNAFAVVKVTFLVVLIVLGFVNTGVNLGGPTASMDNFNNAFSGAPKNAASFASAFIYVLYTYSGFEQPFYVLAECSRPRRLCPTWTMVAMAIATTLFLLVNVVYYCVVPKGHIQNAESIATEFLGRLFGNEMARQAMAGMIAVSVFGNILVMTFTQPASSKKSQKKVFSGRSRYSYDWHRHALGSVPSLEGQGKC